MTAALAALETPSAAPGATLPRVLVITAMYPTPANPAWGSFVRAQVEALRAAGVEIEVLVLQGRNRKLIYPRGVLELRRRLATRRFDVVHAHYGYVGMVARTQWRVPLVVTYHGDDLLGTIGPRGGLTRWSQPVVAAGRLLAHMADAVIVQSAQMAMRVPRAHVHVVPHEVDLELFRPMARDTARQLIGLDPAKRYLLFAANPAIHVKRYPLAQQVAARLAEQDTSVELLVVYRETQERLACYMNACDALVFPSYQEGSPNIVKQAMACNLPIVATPVGDVPQLLDGSETSRVCQPDVTAFATALRTVLDAGARSTDRARVTHLAGPIVARRVIRVYEDAMFRHRRGRPALFQEA